VGRAEGSILFWTLLATGWASLVLYRYRARLPALMPWVGATLALGSAFFFAVMAWPGDPFVRVTPIALEGNGPNALLQNHPFMGLHPPLLYLGIPAGDPVRSVAAALHPAADREGSGMRAGRSGRGSS
jgi:cytochrome c biogenesis factor